MLPKLLTENLCSLRSNVDRLAFSVIWEIDKDSNIIKSKYCKTIIRSRRAFTYMEAQ
jgi:exosome complex exonuclease DIS3/RRP44